MELQSPRARSFSDVVVSGTYSGTFVIDAMRYELVMGGRFRPGGAGGVLGLPADILMVTHLPNLNCGFGDVAADMADRETRIFLSDEGRVVVVGRVRIGEWSSLSSD
jgi:hypothetical protein